MKVSAASSARPESRRVRRPIAVLVSRFPRITETFILREIDELERQGQPVVLVPLLRERPSVVHPEARPWTDRALYSPFLSWRIVTANLRVLRRRPCQYFATLIRLVAGTLRSPGFLVRSLLFFPKAVYLAERLPEEGVVHLHAHFATHPATVAWVVRRLSPVGFSFTAHAHDLFVDATFLGEKVRTARFIRAISDFNRRWLAERWPEAEEKTAVIHMGLEPERFEAPRVDAGDDPPLLLCVAALESYKGIPVLLEACRLLRDRGLDFRCSIVGGGRRRRALERRIRALGIDGWVELSGPRTQEEVAELMERSRLVVLPSVVAPDGQMEGLPVVLMEAAAAGRAVVAPRLSGIPELVEDRRSGLLFPPGDSASLARAIEHLLHHPEEARRLGRNAREVVDQAFLLEDTAGALLSLLDRENPPPVSVEETLARVLSGGSPVGIERIHEGPDARVLEILVGSTGEAERMIVKEHRNRPGQSAPPAERGAREARVLDRLDDLRARGIDLGAPRLVRSDETTGVLLLEAISGEPLDSFLRKARIGPRRASAEELRAVGHRCGAWLRRFQDEMTAPSGPDLVVEWSRRVDRAIGKATRRGRLPPRVRKAARKLRSTGAKVLELGNVVARHGDFWPGNVHVTKQTLTVLDFEGFGPGAPWEDGATFLVHAALFFPPPLGGRFRSLAEGFLAGFDRPRGPDLAISRAGASLFALAAGGWKTGNPVLSAWRRRRLLTGILQGAA